MNNRSIAWWLRQIGLPQYTKNLEGEFYGLEGLLNVTEEELRGAGVEDPSHRETILKELERHRHRVDPHSGDHVKRRVSRKHSLGSSMDLPRKDLFRQSVLTHLQRADKKHRLSASCSQLQPLTKDHKDLKEESKHSKRRSVATYLSQFKVFHGGRREMDALKKELEEELKLSTDDVRSHAWYHGALSREASEALLERDGDFLVRESSSAEGDYVLSCFWKDDPMHFKIIRVVLRPKKGYSRELFQFEEDRFDSVPALIRFYVGGRQPISKASGAVIFHPIARTLPLRVISERQEESKNKCKRMPNSDRVKRRSFSTIHGDMLQVTNPLLRSGSHPTNLENVGCSASLQSAQSDSNLRTGVPQKVESRVPPPLSPVFRTGSEPLLSPRAGHSRPCLPGGGVTLRGSDGQLHQRAPPKPLRISTMFPNAVPPPPSNTDRDPSSLYDELIIRVPMRRKGHVDRLRAEEKWQSRARLTETSFGFLEAQKNEECALLLRTEDNSWTFERPQVESTSCFRLAEFQPTLLPENNRPLDPTVLMSLKELFNRYDANTTALHMLSVDCQVARIIGVTEEQRRQMGVASGLELVTLPHGRQLRQDLLERHHLIAMCMAVDILGCTSTVSQRAAVIHKFIILAQALKDHAHNLFSFSAVIKALEMPQIMRLEMTWRALRRNHTDTAVLYEKKLKPFMSALNDGDDSVLEGPIAVPHLLPLLMAMEGEDPVENSEHGCQTLYDLLQSARSSALHANDYQQHAQALLTGWEPVPELLEAFRTEFALRLLWGQSGAAADRTTRYEKFNKILCVLSDKLEPVELPSEGDVANCD
ncbi:breast cancer anti-estrogen resistance protein 3 homolog isoform X2 [Periophthalmus magnuspinnatus]|uniref:breast cancer anti-estrogen resistance protein 3 homolog isoform X2 n=1 Tax=Periophthalmus magnuspinnatus TaxID=409849 RepID=UPI00243705D2|nr:breast cancer anti-estrogen resistance protein 3 homolog isoform X2 [Periophthalmus magnuspinnatus]